MVFKRKLDDQGQVSLYKAQLLAEGFFQKEEIDYLKTFGPVVLLESLLFVVEKLVSENRIPIIQRFRPHSSTGTST